MAKKSKAFRGTRAVAEEQKQRKAPIRLHPAVYAQALRVRDLLREVGLGALPTNLQGIVPSVSLGAVVELGLTMLENKLHS